ncbi:DNA topoisomerase 3-alpha [Bienertia sinuspersici]
MSQASKSSANSKVRCSCGNYAVVRTIRNGPDVGTKFYGCPEWLVSILTFDLLKLDLITQINLGCYCLFTAHYLSTLCPY